MQATGRKDSLVAVVRAVAKTSAGTGEVDTEIHEPAAGVRPGLAASVGDRDAVGLGLIGAPAGRCTGHTATLFPYTTLFRSHIGELGEPELPLLGHLILKDQVAA